MDVIVWKSETVVVTLHANTGLTESRLLVLFELPFEVPLPSGLEDTISNP